MRNEINTSLEGGNQLNQNPQPSMQYYDPTATVAKRGINMLQYR